ncbi:MAG: type VI secretion system baseplate subunit TssE, partial [Acidobacteria bacterium]
RRDLEWLLNTRQCIDEIPDDLKELKKSVLVYGLPDFSQANVKSPSDQARLRRVIVEAIRNFEPRLSDVRVTIEPAREVERALHFRIDALLRVDPVSEPVTFDTTLHLYNGEYEVKGG